MQEIIQFYESDSNRGLMGKLIKIIDKGYKIDAISQIGGQYTIIVSKVDMIALSNPSPDIADDVPY